MNKLLLQLVVTIGSICIVSSWFISCKSGLDASKLSPPKNFIEDAISAYIKSDTTGTIKDYAEIDTGSVIDGFTLSDPTDAEHMLNFAADSERFMFINLPQDNDKKDHILRSLNAAAMRAQLYKNPLRKFKVFNTKTVHERAQEFILDIEQTKSYFVSLITKINNESSANEVIIIDVDDIPEPAKDLLALLTKPHIIALSHKEIDRFDNLFSEKPKDFVTKGLNPGHVYKLSLARLSKSLNSKDKKTKDLSLSVSKVISALDPHANLGAVTRLFISIDPIIEANNASSNLEDELMKSMANFFQTSYKFLISLNLNSRTLNEIHEKTKENSLAFSESYQKLDKIFDRVAVIRSATIPGIENIQRTIDQTKNQLTELRGADLPELERELKEHGEQQTLESISQTKKSLNAHSERLMADNKNLHENTRKTVLDRTEKIITDAQEEIKSSTNEQIENMNQAYTDNLKTAVKKISSDTITALNETKKDMNNSTEQIIKKSSENLMSALDNTEKQITETMIADGDETRTQLKKARQAVELIKAKTDKMPDDMGKEFAHIQGQIKTAKNEISDGVAQVESEIKQTIQQESSNTQDALRKTTKAVELVKAKTDKMPDDMGKEFAHIQGQIKTAKNEISDSVAQVESEIKQTIQQESSNTQDALRKTTKAVELVKAKTDKMPDDMGKEFAHIQGQIKTAKNEISDGVVQTGDDIKTAVNDQTTAAREHIERVIKKALDITESNIKQDAGLQHQATITKINKQQENLSLSVNDDITKQLDEKISLMSQTIESRIAHAIKSIVDNNNDQTKTINTSTAYVVKKEHDFTREELASVKKDIIDIVESEIQQVIGEIKKLPQKNRVQTAAVAKRLASVVVGYVLGKHPSAFSDAVGNTFNTDNKFVKIDGNAIDIGSFNTRNNRINSSINQAPRSPGDGDETTLGDIKNTIEDMLMADDNTISSLQSNFREALQLLGQE